MGVTVEQLDKEKLLISLGLDDMRELSVSFETLDICDKDARMIIMRLLRLACKRAGVAYLQKTLLVEALPCDSGCLLLVTLMEKHSKRRMYKVKRLREYPCFCFFSAESLLSASERLKALDIKLYSNSLWLYKEKFFLIVDYPIVSERVRSILSEYAGGLSGTRVFVSRVRESGKLLCPSNAMSVIGEFMING